MKAHARVPACTGAFRRRSTRWSTRPPIHGPAHGMVQRMAGCLAIAVLALGCSAVQAQSPLWLAAEPDLKPHGLVEPPGISLEQATNIVRRQTGGRVLSAAPAGRRGYEVRVLVDGKRVKTVFVDSRGNLRSRD